ncbi:hypothetical protein ACD502_04185 [Clostridioides difficile]
MKKLMKHLALLISFIMIFSLVGCSNGGDKEKRGRKENSSIASWFNRLLCSN